MRISAGQPSISDEKSSISARKLAIRARVALGTMQGADAEAGRGGHQGGDGHAAKVGCQAITPVEPEMCRNLMTCDKVHKH